MSVYQACTIAGSDSGGGAGIQADLKTFQEREVFGTSVIVAVTAQNTLGVHGVYHVPVAGVLAQLEAVLSDFSITAIKTGMLADATYMRAIADFLADYPAIPLVVDPVMIAKGGAKLMAAEATTTLITRLLPLATLITPNIPEAEAITGLPIGSEADMEVAAAKIQRLGSKNVLIKGGHALNTDQARDYLLLADGSSHWFGGKRYQTQDTHGTGCTFSACVTAELAKGESILAAVATSKSFIDKAICYGLNLGQGHGPTNHWAYRKVKEQKNG